MEQSTQDHLASLAVLIDTYSWNRRQFARGKPLNQSLAKGLLERATSCLTHIDTVHQEEIHYTVRAELLVGYGVDGVDPKYREIWGKFFTGGEKIQSLCKSLGYCEKSIRRYIAQFGQVVAYQLLKKDAELLQQKSSQPPNSITSDQRDEIILKEKFGLTDKQAVLLRICCNNPSIGLKAICDLQDVLQSTVKTHKKAIRKRMFGENQWKNYDWEMTLEIARKALRGE